MVNVLVIIVLKETNGLGENGEKIENTEADILDSIAEAWDRIGRLNKLFEELNK